MSRIKVVKEEKTFVGDVESAVVKPFGNSSHVVVGRRHNGKNVSLIVPENPSYSWVIDADKANYVQLAIVESQIQIKDKRKQRVVQEMIMHVLDDCFTIEELQVVYDLMKSVNSVSRINDLLKTNYSLK